MLENLPAALGHVLQEQRAGIEKTAFHRLALRSGQGAMEVRSVAFAPCGEMPQRYTADGEGLSPPLQWSGVPEAAASLLLIVEDADAPIPAPLVHAIAVNLPADQQALAESALEPDDARSAEIDLGRNSLLATGWLPPDPPPGHGPHRYLFQLFALAPGPAFEGKPGRDAVMQALAERAIASGCLIGTYERGDGTVKIEEPAAVDAVPSGLSAPA